MTFFLKISFLTILIIKLTLFFWIKSNYPDFEFLGKDSDYYDQFALGAQVEASSIWPTLLRWLNDYGLYNRAWLSLVLFLITNVGVPVIFSKLLVSTTQPINNKKTHFWLFSVALSCYPTIYLYSLDLYRDGFMLLLFGFLLHVVVNLKKLKSNIGIYKLYLYVLLTFLVYFFWLLRPYLGFSILVALLLSHFNYSKIKLSHMLISYFLVLLIFNSAGLFDSIFIYRSSEVFEGGGSTLGINLLDASKVSFLLLYIYSAFLQFFGFFINSFGSFGLFIIESLPFMFSCLYIYKNRVMHTRFINFVLLFNLIYATIWVMANDNLGTAIRLRTYNYASMYLVAYSLYIRKSALINNYKKVT